MKKQHLIALLFVLSIKLCLGQDSTSIQIEDKKTEDLLLEIKQEFAPDSRSVYFNYFKNEEGVYTLETSSSKIQAVLLNKERGNGKKFPIEIKILPDRDLKDQYYGVINLSVANLRTRPSHSAELATQALLGTSIDVLKRVGGFYLIRTPDHYLSWVDRYGITLMNQQEMENWQASKRLIFTKDFGHAFQDADEQSSRVSDLILGDIVKAGRIKGGFQEIFFPDGRQAFVKVDYVEVFEDWKTRTKPSADKIIETAKSMLGVPYLWGGTSVKGVDCSGFTKTAFFMSGLILPRDASQQVTRGLALDIMKDGDMDLKKAIKILRKGDLLFFSAAKDTHPEQPITHVAIYIGNGEFIHAAGRVRINSFDPQVLNYDSQSETIVAARRYLGNIGIHPLPLLSSLPAY